MDFCSRERIVQLLGGDRARLKDFEPVFDEANEMLNRVTKGGFTQAEWALLIIIADLKSKVEALQGGNAKPEAPKAPTETKKAAAPSAAAAKQGEELF